MGAWTKYGWDKNDFGIGLAKDRIDALARKKDRLITVEIGKQKDEYYIEAREVKKYPVERIKNYDKFVYVVKKSALKRKKMPSYSTEELFRMGIYS